MQPDVQGVEKDNKAARQYFETAAHLVRTNAIACVDDAG